MNKLNASVPGSGTAANCPKTPDCPVHVVVTRVRGEQQTIEVNLQTIPGALTNHMLEIEAIDAEQQRTDAESAVGRSNTRKCPGMLPED
jgi:hypothetical protein